MATCGLQSTEIKKMIVAESYTANYNYSNSTGAGYN